MKAMTCLLATALAGCAPQPRLVRLFEGGARPPDQVATLWYMDDARIVLHSIDEHSEGLVHRCHRKDACRVEILPGKHAMEVSYAELVRTRGPRGDISVLWVSPKETMRFEVEAGKFYSLSGARGATDEATWKGLDPSRLSGGRRPVFAARDIRPDDWKIRIEPSGDPDQPVQE